MKKIIWTEPAVEHLQAIFDYISKDSEYYARVFIEKIINTVEKLTIFPEIGRIVPEYGKSNVRELLYQNYRIIYRLEGSRILIVTVIHGSRDLTQSDDLHNIS